MPGPHIDLGSLGSVQTPSELCTLVCALEHSIHPRCFGSSVWQSWERVTLVRSSSSSNMSPADLQRSLLSRCCVSLDTEPDVRCRKAAAWWG